MANSETAEFYNLLYFYTVLASWVILFYDHLLQFGREVDLVWTRLSFQRLSLPTILYLLTRFTVPIAYLANIDYDLKALKVTFANVSRRSPAHRDTERPIAWILVLSPNIIAVVLGLRTYAIWEQNRLVLLILVCVGASIPVTGTLVGLSYKPGSHTAQLTRDTPFRSMLQSLTTLIFDTTVIILTVAKSVQSRKMYRRGGFLDVIVRDGIYISVLATTQLINLLFYWKGLVGVSIQPSRTLSMVLTARFLLNLRELYYARCTQASEIEGCNTITGAEFHV
ncbi:hypothetical protein JB92DRAFT_2900416 [Gautieria morchelliformis]|nr:hypothetical protein JB92DRAFT_2900416 [Gautieria morchelliformis]